MSTARLGTTGTPDSSGKVTNVDKHRTTWAVTNMDIPNNWRWERHAYVIATTYIPTKNRNRFRHINVVINKQFLRVNAYYFIK